MTVHSDFSALSLPISKASYSTNPHSVFLSQASMPLDCDSKLANTYDATVTSIVSSQEQPPVTTCGVPSLHTSPVYFATHQFDVDLAPSFTFALEQTDCMTCPGDMNWRCMDTADPHLSPVFCSCTGCTGVTMAQNLHPQTCSPLSYHFDEAIAYQQCNTTSVTVDPSFPFDESLISRVPEDMAQGSSYPYDACPNLSNLSYSLSPDMAPPLPSLESSPDLEPTVKQEPVPDLGLVSELGFFDYCPLQEEQTTQSAPTQPQPSPRKARRRAQKPRGAAKAGHRRSSQASQFSPTASATHPSATRKYACQFAFAGCPALFNTRNEWKRHMATFHIMSQYYLCSEEHWYGRGPCNEVFNRRDLLAQHLRRVLKSIGRSECSISHGEINESCRKGAILRLQPQQPRLFCPGPGCGAVFKGNSPWDARIEHISRHIELNENIQNFIGDVNYDRDFLDWALHIKAIKYNEAGKFICPAPVETTHQIARKAKKKT